jgi:YD repeat-containing protein
LEYDNTYGEWTRETHFDTSTQSALDGFGRVVDTNTNGLKVRFTRDACGRVTFESAPFTTGDGNRGVTTTLDALNRVKAVTAPENQVTQYAYTGIDVTVTDAENRQTLYDYSAAGEVTRLVRVRDAAQVDTQYQHDVSEQLAQVSGPGTTPARTWIYDGAGQLLSDTQPESGTTTYVHNAAGQLTQRTDAMNQVATYSYDQDQRLRTVDLPGAADDLTITYDAIGRVVSQATPTASTTYTHDNAGRVKTRTDVVSGQTFVSTYGYDAKSRLTSLTYPSGRQVTYEYDTFNRLSVVRQQGTVFADTFTYDGSSRLISYRTGPVTHTVAYDEADRIQRLTAGGTALDLTYTYDRVSNVKTIADPRPGMNQTRIRRREPAHQRIRAVGHSELEL